MKDIIAVFGEILSIYLISSFSMQLCDVTGEKTRVYATQHKNTTRHI